MSVQAGPEVHCGSDFPGHSGLWKTLVLLTIATLEGPLYFVVEGLASGDCSDVELQEHERYYYEEHTCPTNFIGGEVVAIFAEGDSDQHGIFDFVRVVWMPQRYLEIKALEHERGSNMGYTVEQYLSEEIFPEIVRGCPRRCVHEGSATSNLDGSLRSATWGYNETRLERADGTYVYVHTLRPGETCSLPNSVTAQNAAR